MHKVPNQLLEAQVYRTECPPDWDWDNTAGHPTRRLDMWLVTAGHGTMQLRGRTYALSAGDCFLIRMNEPCSARHDPHDPLTVHWAFIQYPADHPLDDAHLPAVHRRVRELPFMISLFERALAAQYEKAPDRVESWLLAVLRAMQEDDSRGAPPEGTAAAEQFERIQQIALRIRNSPGHPYALPELARECHCTPGHFTRRFEKCVGSTPREFIVNARIETARSLLRMSDQKISSIATILGYGDVFHFSKQFKQKTGQSPGAYRRNALQSIAMAAVPPGPAAM